MTELHLHETCALEDVPAHIEDTTPGDVFACTYNAPAGVIPETMPNTCNAKVIRDGNLVCLRGVCVKAVVDWIKQGNEPIYPMRGAVQQPIDRSI